MLVRDIMQREVVTIRPVATVLDALWLAQRRGIRHLPVVDDRLIGIVSDRDLKRAMAAEAARAERPGLACPITCVPVSDIMSRAVITVGPEVPVEEAARLMLDERISALPVVEGGRLVGIVTETDVMRLFVRAMGARLPSTRLDVVVGERPAALAELVRAITDCGVPLVSVVTLTAPDGITEAVVRIATINPEPVIRALEAKRFTLRWASPAAVNL